MIIVEQACLWVSAVLLLTLISEHYYKSVLRITYSLILDDELTQTNAQYVVQKLRDSEFSRQENQQLPLEKTDFQATYVHTNSPTAHPIASKNVEEGENIGLSEASEAISVESETCCPMLDMYNAFHVVDVEECRQECLHHMLCESYFFREYLVSWKPKKFWKCDGDLLENKSFEDCEAACVGLSCIGFSYEIEKQTCVLLLAMDSNCGDENEKFDTYFRVPRPTPKTATGADMRCKKDHVHEWSGANDFSVEECMWWVLNNLNCSWDVFDYRKTGKQYECGCYPRNRRFEDCEHFREDSDWMTFKIHNLINLAVPAHKCLDTPYWNNGMNDCDSYVTNGWCKDGNFVSGMEWTGSPDTRECNNYNEMNETCAKRFNFPAKNCCACGKPATIQNEKLKLDNDGHDGYYRDIANWNCNPDVIDSKNGDPLSKCSQNCEQKAECTGFMYDLSKESCELIKNNPSEVCESSDASERMVHFKLTGSCYLNVDPYLCTSNNEQEGCTGWKLLEIDEDEISKREVEYKKLLHIPKSENQPSIAVVVSVAPGRPPRDFWKTYLEFWDIGKVHLFVDAHTDAEEYAHCVEGIADPPTIHILPEMNKFAVKVMKQWWHFFVAEYLEEDIIAFADDDSCLLYPMTWPDILSPDQKLIVTGISAPPMAKNWQGMTDFIISPNKQAALFMVDFPVLMWRKMIFDLWDRIFELAGLNQRLQEDLSLFDFRMAAIQKVYKSSGGEMSEYNIFMNFAYYSEKWHDKYVWNFAPTVSFQNMTISSPAVGKGQHHFFCPRPGNRGWLKESVGAIWTENFLMYPKNNFKHWSFPNGRWENSLWNRIEAQPDLPLFNKPEYPRDWKGAWAKYFNQTELFEDIMRDWSLRHPEELFAYGAARLQDRRAGWERCANIWHEKMGTKYFHKG